MEEFISKGISPSADLPNDLTWLVLVCQLWKPVAAWRKRSLFVVFSLVISQDIYAVLPAFGLTLGPAVIGFFGTKIVTFACLVLKSQFWNFLLFTLPSLSGTLFHFQSVLLHLLPISPPSFVAKSFNLQLFFFFFLSFFLYPFLSFFSLCSVCSVPGRHV